MQMLFYANVCDAEAHSSYYVLSSRVARIKYLVLFPSHKVFFDLRPRYSSFGQVCKLERGSLQPHACTKYNKQGMAQNDSGITH